MAEEQLKIAALEYHEHPSPGKISISPTKGLANQRDLSLAYSPGVAYACTAIKENPLDAARYTSRANLVGVVTNGSAVLAVLDGDLDEFMQAYLRWKTERMHKKRK